MKIIPKEYDILRSVKVGLEGVPLKRMPVRIATLMDEDDVLATQRLVHNQNVFLEERNHDWRWHNGRLFYFSRVTQQSDVIALYSQEYEKTCTGCKSTYIDSSIMGIKCPTCSTKPDHKE